MKKTEDIQSQLDQASKGIGVDAMLALYEEVEQIYMEAAYSSNFIEQTGLATASTNFRIHK